MTNRSVLFLDFDDLLCLNSPFGGFDVMTALSQVEKTTATVQDFREIWAQLFGREAHALLERINAEFAPQYVLSTSCRLFMNRDALVAVLMNTGLEFVARNLHEHWQTPHSLSPQLRAREIGSWRDMTRIKTGSYSMTSARARASVKTIPSRRNSRSSCCAAKGGDWRLEMIEYEKLCAAFELRRSMADQDLGRTS